MTAVAGTEQSEALRELVTEMRAIVRRERPAEQTAEMVAQCLGPKLSRQDLLTASQREGNPDAYRQHVLHVEDDGSFSVVSLVWLPGQRTPIHDHVSWCVVGVHEGEEAEVQYRLEGQGEDRFLVETGTSVNAQGSVCGFVPPGDLHEVWNAGSTKAISLHVYGADIGRLGSSIRRRYDFPIRNAD